MKSGTSLWAVGGIVSVGSLIGLYAGLSSSPVVGTLISATLGVLAGIITGFIGKITSVKRETGDKSNEDITATADHSAILRMVGKAVILFCIANVMALFIGMEIRTGAITRSLFAEEPEQPLAISDLTKNQGVRGDLYLRLLIVQRIMQDRRIPTKETNANLRFLSGENADKWGIAEDRLTEIEGFLRDHWNFMSSVRKTDIETRLRNLEDSLTKNNVSTDFWKADFDSALLGLDRQPDDYESEREQAAVAKALYGIREVKSPELDVVLQHLRDFSQSKVEFVSEVEYRPSLAN